MALSARKAAFIAEYSKDLNATQAAIRAGYSEHTAYSQGSRLLKDVDVQQALQQVGATAVQVIEQAQHEAVASAEYVIRKSLDMAEYGSALVPTRTMFGEVIKDEQGEPVMRMRDWRAADAGLTRLAKMHPATFAPEAGSGEQGARHLHLHGLSEPELRALANGLRS